MPRPVDFLDGIDGFAWMPNRRELSYVRAGAVGLLSWATHVRRELYRPAAGSADPYADSVRGAQDGKGVYFKSHDAQGLTSFWSIPVTGGRPVLLVTFHDPLRQSSRFDFAVGAGRFFFTIDDRRSNIWIAEVTER
jgi:hypothetical protein